MSLGGVDAVRRFGGQAVGPPTLALGRRTGGGPARACGAGDQGRERSPRVRAGDRGSQRRVRAVHPRARRPGEEAGRKRWAGGSILTVVAALALAALFASRGPVVARARRPAGLAIDRKSTGLNSS